MSSVVDVVTDEVATNLEEVAAVTRGISAKGVGVFLGGLAVGAVVGAYFGYRWNKEKIKAEVFKESSIEVEKLRQFYMQREANQGKPSIEEVIEERGYAVVVDDEPKNEGSGKSDKKRTSKTPKRPTRPPVVAAEPPLIKRPTIVSSGAWNYPEELANRNPDEPYVIHQDELKESDYANVTYTYYDKDDVLTDEDDRPLPHADLVVGQDNLKWGHGSDDDNVVFVRNDRLELDMEICRSPKSYEEDVLGLDNVNPN